jgi:ABC-type antimicrobial peptide transport system permease subunit
MMSLKGDNDPESKPVTLLLGDDRFCSMYGLKLKAGRFVQASDTNFISQSFPAGQRFAKSVVNEKLVKTLGFASPQEALGKKFWIGMNDWTADIVGVVENFNTTSLHEDITSTLITAAPFFANKAGVKIQSGSDIPATIDKINNSFKKVYSKGIFEFNFLDEQIDTLYKTESRLYVLFKIFSALAMLISCLGLWGLVNFAAQKRVKEIGIRKVLGASISNIVALLTKDFIILVSIAIAIASPLAYFGITKWLQGFAFRINIGWSVFAIAAVAALLIALVTVSFQAVRSAFSNPVKSLRTE